jgi:chemotaxis protein methyltransferase CheR
LRALTKSRIIRKLWGIHISQARWIWNRFPSAVRELPMGRAYAKYLDRLVRTHATRRQEFATFFLRNRAELELLRRLADQRPHGSPFTVSVLACSKGAEVYSIAWAIRTMRPDLQLRITAVDISPEIIDFAARGVYSLDTSDAVARSDERVIRNRGPISWNTSRGQNAWMFERMSKEEMEEMFEIQGDRAHVRPWLQQGITWTCGDARDHRLRARMGFHDVVLANRFLCHMKPEEARQCLINVAQLVRSGGYLFVSGVDLDVRTEVARELDWEPVMDLIRETHDGDASIRRGWPLEYWGLEPLDDGRVDWQLRYASVFRLEHRLRAMSELAPAGD